MIDRADPPHHVQIWRSDYPTRHASAIIKVEQISQPKKIVFHSHYTDPADRTDRSDHADPPTQRYSAVNHGMNMFD